MHDAKVCLSMVCVSLRGGRGERERERGGYVGSNKNTRHTCRPNIVVKECNAYDEDKWRMLFIGGIRLHVVKPCSRCKITTTDQETGYRGEEPLTTLSTFRLKEHVKAPCGDSVDVFFGQNLCHESPGSVSKGDVVLARYWDYPWFMQSYSGFY